MSVSFDVSLCKMRSVKREGRDATLPQLIASQSIFSQTNNKLCKVFCSSA